MRLARKDIRDAVCRIVNDYSTAMKKRVEDRINEVLSEIVAEANWTYLRATSTFQTVAAITKGEVSMPQESALITYVSYSTSPRVAGREIIIGEDGRSYYIAKYSSGTTIVANMPREFDTCTTKSHVIVQPVYRIPLVAEKVESIVDMSAPVDNDGSLDYMGRRERDRTYPTTAIYGVPERYFLEDDEVTSYGSGNMTMAETSKHAYFDSAAFNYKTIEDGQQCACGSHVFTIASKVSGSHLLFYEPAKEAISAQAYSLELRKRRVRLHPAPEEIKTYQVRYYKKEAGLQSDGDYWKADGRWHRLLIDGTAAKILAELQKETAALFEKRYTEGKAQFKREDNKSADDTEQQMKVDIEGNGYRDTWV